LDRIHHLPRSGHLGRSRQLKPIAVCNGRVSEIERVHTL
jgi:hypothetical protein